MGLTDGTQVMTGVDWQTGENVHAWGESREMRTRTPGSCWGTPRDDARGGVGLWRGGTFADLLRSSSKD